MPAIVCPTCSTKLEIDDDMLGEEVQCGSCQEIFKAEAPSKRGSRRGDEEEEEKPRKSKYRKDEDDGEEDERPSKRRSRMSSDDEGEDDEEDYEDRRSRRRRRGSQEASQGLGIASLVLGIIGILLTCCCGLLGLPLPIAAIITGVLSLKTPGKGMGIAGISMGVIAIVLSIILLFANIGINAANGGFGGGGRGGRF